MGKIVKFCAKCEEGFAAKFGFCPNCGEALEAFEMNPLQAAAVSAAATPAPEAPVSEPVAEPQPAAETVSLQNSFETLPKVEETPVAIEPAAEEPTVDFSGDDILELNSVDVAEEKAPEPFVPVEKIETNGSNGHGRTPLTRRTPRRRWLPAGGRGRSRPTGWGAGA